MSTDRAVEHVEIGGYRFSLISIVPFEDWLHRIGRNMNDFMGMSRPDKEQVFLRWKWGFSDPRANEELEISEKRILFQYKESDLEDLNEGTKFHIQKKRDFDQYCFRLRQRLGLAGMVKNATVDKVVKAFGAHEY